MKNKMKTIKIESLSQQAFAPFGDVIEIDKYSDFIEINNGTTKRFHDLAKVQIKGTNARTAISIFRANPFDLPYSLNFMERHPYGSQNFMPLIPSKFLVIVAQDKDGVPTNPIAFLASEGQGVNYHSNIWHGALVALDRETDFLVVDREGEENNLEIYDFEKPYRVEL